MRALALASLGSILIGACGGDAPPPRPTGAIDGAVTHYDLTFDLDSRLGHARAVMTTSRDGDCFALPVRADVDLASASLIAAADDTAGTLTPSTATRTGDVLEVCGAGWPAGTALVLDVDLEIPLATLADSQVGYSLAQDGRFKNFWFLISWVGGCDRFAPCDNRPDAFATYTFDVTHAAGVKVRCPGTISEPSATRTVCDFTYDGGPTYSTFGLVASDGWTVTDLGDWAGVATTLYDTGSNVPARIDAAYHAGFMAWMQDHFGAFPYGDALRILTAPTYWAGFEHPGNIVLDDSLGGGLLGAYTTSHTLNHEIAHQWAGDQTTLADTYDFVWKEAMAEYLSFVYEDETNPAFGIRTAKSWRTGAVGAAYNLVPAEQPPLFDYYGDVYGPGPMVLFRQLEVMTSREAVLDALASVLGQASVLSVPDLQAALEASTGLDLTAYFDAWVYGSGAPTWPTVELAAVVAPDSGDVTLTVDHTNAATSAGPCTFHVALTGAAGEEVLVKVDLAAGPTIATTVPAPGFDVVDLVLDPLAECLVYPAATIAAARRHPPGWTPWRVAAP